MYRVTTLSWWLTSVTDLQVAVCSMHSHGLIRKQSRGISKNQELSSWSEDSKGIVKSSRLGAYYTLQFSSLCHGTDFQGFP
ncbi:hypothetical protein RRG08_039883 [Elysia crispata]|uniref:Secreted protein n=1 Tax=Elysia crispata TaxID=231223 RepID=A0AAE1DNF3_9GAST|nr:hypothetical protein RRG08_039883 [Elysia crispata]